MTTCFLLNENYLDDHSRVILANRSRDYINANYIDVSMQSLFDKIQFTIYIQNSVKTELNAIPLVIIIFKGLKKKNQFIACQG